MPTICHGIGINKCVGGAGGDRHFLNLLNAENPFLNHQVNIKYAQVYIPQSVVEELEMYLVFPTSATREHSVISPRVNSY